MAFWKSLLTQKSGLNALVLSHYIVNNKPKAVNTFSKDHAPYN
jgi:hypothetical protein